MEQNKRKIMANPIFRHILFCARDSNGNPFFIEMSGTRNVSIKKDWNE
jgi:hypothetical protein